MKIIINLFENIINFLDFLFKTLFKKNFKGFLFDKLQQNFRIIKINNLDVKFYCPGSVSTWRLDTFFSKEPQTLKWVENFKKYNLKKILFWDIGANIGLYSIYSCFVNDLNKINVVAFEPSPNNYKILCSNISTNNLDKNILLFANPLNSSNIISNFYESSNIDGSALNSFSNTVNFEGKQFKPSISFKTIGFSLDFLINNNFLDIPNFIKIDVDGNEHLILEGFKKHLSNSNILEILVEVNENYQEQFNSIKKIMDFNNLKLYEKYPAAINGSYDKKFMKTFNYLFKRN
jgi:FkbM family methyltransferase